MSDTRGATLCYLLFFLWLVALLLSILLSPSGGQVAISLLFLLLFVVVHSSLSYGWSGFAAFFSITFIVSFLLEASSIAFGFPFGFYVHHFGGPALFGVPLPVPVGYFIIGWFGWTLARVIVRDDPRNTNLRYRFTTPLIASFILAGFDLVSDPIGASVIGAVTYRNPSGLFGVPLTNYLGWLFTGWAFFQIFALIEFRFRPRPALNRRGYWLLPAAIWIAMALQYPVMFVRAPAATVEAGGRTFVTADIYETAVILSLFTNVLFGLLAGVKVFDMPKEARSPLQESGPQAFRS